MFLLCKDSKKCTMHNAQCIFFLIYGVGIRFFLLTLQDKRDDKPITFIDYILVDVRAVRSYFKFLFNGTIYCISAKVSSADIYVGGRSGCVDCNIEKCNC